MKNVSKLTFLLASACCAADASHAAITIDLSFVDMQSAAYERFEDWVDQAVAGSPGYGFSANDAALQFKLTNHVPYCTLAVSMIETQVTNAETAIASGTNPAVAYDSYLHVGAMIGDLALTYDWCSAQMASSQRSRWSAYAERTITNVWDPGHAQWGGRPAEWTGWGTDDPANNYHYSFLRATMYWALASNSSPWRTFLQTRKLPPLQSYFASLPGGGSEEGTGYGTSHHKLFELYRVWRDSTGSDLANANPHLTDTISYWLHATVPTLDRFAPYGDQSRNSIPEFYDYHRHLILEARQMSASTAARELASWWLNNNSVSHMSSAFNYRDDLLPAGSSTPLPSAPLVYHATGIGHLFARTGWDTGATWLSFTAGSFNQSHAHQDQGSFTLFSDDWLAVTENIWSDSGIQQGTEVHNLVRFVRNGATVHQEQPSVSHMDITQLGPSPGEVHVTANLTPAYEAGSGINAWQRKLDFSGGHLVVKDQFTVSPDVQAVFQVNTPARPIINGREATAGRLHIRVVEPVNATLTSMDWHTVDDEEFNSGWKLEVRGPAANTGFVVELGVQDVIFADGFDS